MTVPRRLLVTGAQGFLGRHVVAAALAQGTQVVGVGRSPRDDGHYTHTLGWCGRRVPAPLPESLRTATSDARYRYLRVDLRDSEAVAGVVGSVHPDAVISAAAALRDSPWPSLAAANIDGTMGLVRGILTASLVPAPTIVLVSSGSVYGTGAASLPFAEDGVLEPADLYGVSKRTAEDLARVLLRDADVSLVSARVFNLVGPGLDDRHFPAHLAARLAEITRGLAPPVLPVGALSGTRDFIDVRDAAAALLVLAGNPKFARVVNVASGLETQMRDLVQVALQLAGLADTVRVDEGSPRPGAVVRSVADVSRLRRLGALSERPVTEPLAALLAYYARFPIG